MTTTARRGLFIKDETMTDLYLTVNGVRVPIASCEISPIRMEPLPVSDGQPWQVIAPPVTREISVTMPADVAAELARRLDLMAPLTPREDKLIAALRRCYIALADCSRATDYLPRSAAIAKESASTLLSVIDHATA